MSFLTYGDDGRATWYVVPDARYSVEATGAGRFDGRIYAAFGSQGVIASGLQTLPGVVELGSAVLREETSDAATLQIDFGGTQVERRIARLRF
ncbi:MAG TPA: hypothetical protein VFP44_10515 [Usitatibacter sp.]|nr:hypothetical protein [Usitatibacter sp.]